MKSIKFKLYLILCLMIVLISYIQNVPIDKGHSFISLQMNKQQRQSEEKEKMRNGDVNETLKPIKDNKPSQLFKTAIIDEKELGNDINQTVTTTTPLRFNIASSNTSQLIKQEQLQQKQQQQHQHQSESNDEDNNELSNARSDILSILDNIKALGSELITTSSSSKDILKQIDDLQNDFERIQFEITTNSNEQHKRIGILNKRISSHFKEELSRQLFLIDQAEEEIESSIKTNQKELASIESEIYLNSKCTSYQTCFQCATDASCGWCVSTNKCIEGDSDKPLFSQCPSYSYSICDNEALCSQATCGACIANVVCSWCANSPKPYCSKAINMTNCNRDLTISIIGDNAICPMVNFKLKYEGAYQHDFLKESVYMENRRQLKEKYNSIDAVMQKNKTKLDDLKKQREKIEDQIELVNQQKEDFEIIEEDKNQTGFSDDFQKKMMNVYRTELLTFLENLKKTIANQK